jgi:pimeloyl-ACP methyl ester carboxylesterase
MLIYNKKLFLSVILAEIAFVLFSGASVASASAKTATGTHVSGTISADTYWTENDSPYILDGQISIDPGVTLDVGPGVVIERASTTGSMDIFGSNGILKMHGLPASHISITGIGQINLSFTDLSMSYTDMYDGPNLVLHESFGTIASSSFMRTNGSAVYVWGGSVNISGSRFEQNQFPAIYAVDGMTGAPSITVHDSIFKDNKNYDIQTHSGSALVHAEKNWWGSASGPYSTGYDPFRGSVSYDPWLTSEPDLGPKMTTCCSSVLFLPGFEGSRLYRPDALPFGGTIPHRLWEPGSNASVQALFMDTNGSSTDPSIYSGGPIPSAYGLSDIYSSFIGFMDRLTLSGTIREWRPFGYDWRRSIADVVNGPEHKENSTESLIQTINDLANRSRTGKVTIIAHSNGGLVAKYLVKALSDIGEGGLIDSVISVAVPYLGTPQAIASILHGNGGSLAKGLFLTESIARQFAKNVPSAYSLLPSSEFFSKVLGPTVAFASTTILGLNDGSYPPQILTLDDQISFMADTANMRREPSATDLKDPIRANLSLLDAADALHSILDPFSWPAAITRWAIMGWNSDTMRNILYKAKGYSIGKTKMGDGTVLVPSAAYQAGTSTSIDLKRVSTDESKNLSHANILESSSTQAAIRKIITKDPGSYCDEVAKMPGVSCGEPDYSKEQTSLVMSTHSPVELHIYDDSGRHLGVAPIPTGADEPVEAGLLTYIEEGIPGASLETHETDNGDIETYAYLPDDGRRYRVEIRGTGVGTFTYDVERKRGSLNGAEQTLGQAEYGSVPVTPFTIATTSLQISAIGLDATTTVGFASSTKLLAVDADGNGSPDYFATSSPMIDTDASAQDMLLTFEELKKTIIAIYGSTSSDAKSLLRRIDKLESTIQGGNAKKLADYASRLMTQMGHKSPSNVSDADKAQVMNLISIYISQFE